MPLWRALEALRSTMREISHQIEAVYPKLGLVQYPHVAIGTETKTDPQTGRRVVRPRYFFTAAEIDDERDRLLELDLGGAVAREKILTRFEGHKQDLARRRAEHERLKRETGLDLLEEREDAAIKADLAAEAALVEHGFRSPAAIIAGLHRFVLLSTVESLDEYAASLLRRMVEPLLDQVPAELAAAFRRDWPSPQVAS